MNCKFLFLLLLFAPFCFFSCENEINSLGLDLQGDQLGNNFSDTTLIVAYSVQDDSIYTSNLSANILGHVNDPIFGATTASIYSQFPLSGNSINFGDSPQLDSVVLTLKYSGYFGDTLSPISIKVHELSEKLSASTFYYHTSSVGYNDDNLTYNSHFTVAPKPNTPVTADTSTTESQLRIRLKNDFGYKFLNNPSQMVSDDLFENFFYGLYITAETSASTGNLIYVNMTSSLTGIQIYYKKDGENYKYTLAPSSGGVRFNSFTHDVANADPDFLRQIFNTPVDTNLGKEILYVQGAAGVAAKIAFPTLKQSFADKNVVINRAELVITNVANDENIFLHPDNLAIQGFTKSGSSVFIPDDSYYTTTDYFGGSYDATTKEYRFRITKYVQDLIFDEYYRNYIYLRVAGTGIRAPRLICGGSDPILDPNSRIRLEISYTTY